MDATEDEGDNREEVLAKIDLEVERLKGIQQKLEIADSENERRLREYDQLSMTNKKDKKPEKTLGELEKSLVELVRRERLMKKTGAAISTGIAQLEERSGKLAVKLAEMFGQEQENCETRSKSCCNGPLHQDRRRGKC